MRLGMQFSEKKQYFEIKRRYSNTEKDKKNISATLRDVHYFTRTGMPFDEYKNEKKRNILTIGAALFSLSRYFIFDYIVKCYQTTLILVY